MNGGKIGQIAKSLGIPVGTVKSRLDSGRKQIKKGIDTMENYAKQSYQPERLYVSNSGQSGMNMEPGSVVENDKIAQNLLILAYDKPVTELELSKAIGIPTVYIEPIIEKLIKNELMKRTDGGKVYTDFILYRLEDKSKHLAAQEEFANSHFNSFWQPIDEGLDKFRKMDFYDALNIRQQKKLEYYFLLHTLENSIYGVGYLYYKPWIDFPDRPNGGKWIAFGNVYPEVYDINTSPGYKYAMAGERKTCFDGFMNSKYLRLYEYDTILDDLHRYSGLNYPMFCDDMAKLLYIIHSGINPNDTGFNIMFFENIPKFAERGIFTMEDSHAKVDIPVLTNEAYIRCRETCQVAIGKIMDNIKEPLFAYLKDRRQAIPPHLKSVPEQKQYLTSMWCIEMAVVFEAKKRDLLFKDVDYICPPIVLVVDSFLADNSGD